MAKPHKTILNVVNDYACDCQLQVFRCVSDPIPISGIRARLRSLGGIVAIVEITLKSLLGSVAVTGS